MHEQLIARAEDIVAARTGAGTHCVLALMDADGSPVASAITASKAEGIRLVTLCTGFGTRTARIAGCARASLCFATEDCNVTLVGRIDVLTDPAVKQEMWYAGLSNHFSGPDDPGYCVLRFTTQRYSLLVDGRQARGAL